MDQQNQIDIENQKPVRRPSVLKLELYTAIVAGISFLCTGLMRTYTSSALPSMEEDENFINSTEIPDTVLLSWIASATPLAGFAGTVVSGPILQTYGRQKLILLTAVPFLAGWLLIGLLGTVKTVITGRILTGIASGMSTSGAGLYVSECVRPEVRGLMGYIPSMMLAFGVLLGFCMTPLELNWHTLALLQAAFPLCLLILSLFAPESPMWLMMNGKSKEAIATLTRLRGPYLKEEEIIELSSQSTTKACPEDDKPNDGNCVKRFIKQFCTRGVLVPLYISLTLMILQQLCGINALIYYLSSFVEVIRPKHLPDEETNSKVVSVGATCIIIGLVQFLGFFGSVFVIERVGRRGLLISSAGIMCVAHVFLGTYFHFHSNDHFGFVEETFVWMPLSCLCLFVVAYSIGFGPVPFIIMSEIFPSQLRSYFCSLSSLVSYLSLFGIVLVYPQIMQALQPEYVFWTFASFSAISTVFVIYCVPETKGKSLAEIEQYFRGETEEKSENCITRL